MVDFTSPTWKDTLAFVEPNLVGVGGIVLIPALEQVMMDVIVPALQRVAPDLQLSRPKTLRKTFMHELQRPYGSIGRPKRRDRAGGRQVLRRGPAEFVTLAEYYTERGYKVVYIDPAELSCATKAASEVYYEDTRST